MISFYNPAEQQKNQRAFKKSRYLKQTHERKLEGNLSPITTKIDIVNEITRNLGEIVERLDDEGDNTQTLAIEKTQYISHPNVYYDTSLENTLPNTKK